MPGPSGRVGRGGERIIGSVTKGGGGASSLDSPSSDGGSKTGGAIGASTGRGRVGGVRYASNVGRGRTGVPRTGGGGAGPVKSRYGGSRKGERFGGSGESNAR